MTLLKKKPEMKTNLPLRTIALLSLVCLCSCLPLHRLGPSQDKDAPMIFRSDTHIICILTSDTTPALLAKKFMGDKAKAWMIEDENKTAQYRSGETIIIPLTRDNPAGLQKNGYQTVPILCYHRFSKNCASPLCMPQDVFARQMKYLKDNHYRVISMAMLQDFIAHKKALPKKSVALTIDDGYQSFHDIAFPILKHHGFKASLFIYTDFVSVGSALTWDQLREIKAAGFEVGSHTLSHADLAVKTPGESETEYLLRITREMALSKQILDRELNQDTTLFAFPFGSSNPQVIDICKKSGYEIGVTVNRGGNPFFMHPFMLNRDQVLSRKQPVFINRLKTLRPISLVDKNHE